jgi:hypothetical protein
MFDSRLTWAQVTHISSIYYMANCHHFINSEVKDMAPYEPEVFAFVREQAQQFIPFICVDKTTKTTARDIAKNAYANAIAAINNGAANTARRQIQEGTNGIVKLVLKEPLYGMMVESYATYLKIVKSPINALTEEEQILLSACGFAFRNKCINAGLVRP